MGSLAKHTAVDLACLAGAAAMQDVGGQLPTNRAEVIVGNVLSAGLGMNVARQVAIGLEIPVCCPAYTVNMMCGSGMKAIMLACDSIRSRQAQVVLCGGTESMTQAPYLLPRARQGLKLGDASLVDSILCDGLVDAFDHQPMGVSAERLARDYSITREQQDQFACQSQHRYAAARAAGRFASQLVTVGELVEDEHPRPETTLAALSKLRPNFDPQGSVTAGNASGINDGAAMVLLSDLEFARQHKLRVLALIEDYVAVGCDPARMGLGPVFATERLLQRQSLTLEAFDSIELNEAFAAQVLACKCDLQLDDGRLNQDGGSIATGHPIGATGARLVVHLAHRIADGLTERGLATLCVGGGMGLAINLKRECS